MPHRAPQKKTGRDMGGRDWATTVMSKWNRAIKNTSFETQRVHNWVIAYRWTLPCEAHPLYRSFVIGINLGKDQAVPFVHMILPKGVYIPWEEQTWNHEKSCSWQMSFPQNWNIYEFIGNVGIYKISIQLDYSEIQRTQLSWECGWYL
jgi:hypothetical protein